MPGEISNLTFRDLIEKILKEGLNTSDFVAPAVTPSRTNHPEPSVHTEINRKVIDDFLKP